MPTESPAEELRRRFPRLAECVDDFYEMKCGRVFDWAQQAQGWQAAQRILCREYMQYAHRVEMETLKESVKLRAAFR